MASLNKNYNYNLFMREFNYVRNFRGYYDCKLWCFLAA